MSKDKRASMLMKAMEQLRERYPDETSEWIRNRAEVMVEKKLGPETPPPSMPDPRAEPAQPEQTETDALPRFVNTTSLGTSATLFFGLGIASIMIGIFISLAGIENLNAITQVTFETIKMSWWLTGLGFMILGGLARCTKMVCDQQRAVAFHIRSR